MTAPLPRFAPVLIPDDTRDKLEAIIGDPIVASTVMGWLLVQPCISNWKPPTHTSDCDGSNCELITQCEAW